MYLNAIAFILQNVYSMYFKKTFLFLNYGNKIFRYVPIDCNVIGMSNFRKLLIGLSWKKDRIRSRENVCSLNNVESSAEQTTILPEILKVCNLVALCHKYMNAIKSICPATSNSVRSL